MAVPTVKTIHDLSGQWYLNKTLSSGMERVLKLQGVNWILRQAICHADITLDISHHQSSASADQREVSSITIDNIALRFVQGTRESRIIDWTWRDHKDYIWGQVRGRCKYASVEELKAAFPAHDLFLTSDWLEDEAEIEKDCILLETVEAIDQSWKSVMIWGFSDIQAQRRFVRKVVVERASQKAEALLVYDFVS